MEIPFPELGRKPKMTLPPVEEPKLLTTAEVSAIAQQLIANVEKVIVGKHEQVVLATAVWLAEGHLLIEDVPGVAKTMLARAMAQSAGCTFKRIQCTPDLLPLDVLGENYVDPQSGRTEFRFGPLFSQFVLVDEINRASPRTQSALLEAMGEGMVTMDRVSYRLEKPFMVMATQNPIEQEGTFRLPEAQMDRFILRLSLGYPSAAEEKEMCRRVQQQHPIDTLTSVTTAEQILKCQRGVREILVGSEACDYLVALVRATREHPALKLGASPRGSLGLFRAAQSLAAVQGDSHVTTDHVKAVVEPVLAHRLMLRQEARKDYPDGAAVIQEIVARPAAG
jgi:MoxR-like ATPase